MKCLVCKEEIGNYKYCAECFDLLDEVNKRVKFMFDNADYMGDLKSKMESRLKEKTKLVIPICLYNDDTGFIFVPIGQSHT